MNITNFSKASVVYNSNDNRKNINNCDLKNLILFNIPGINFAYTNFVAIKNVKKDLNLPSSLQPIADKKISSSLLPPEFGQTLTEFGSALKESLTRPVTSFITQAKKVLELGIKIVSQSKLVNALLKVGETEGGIAQMEVFWNTPVGLLSTTIKDLEGSLASRGWNKNKINDFIHDLPHMRVQDYISKIILPFGTGCCGQTANILEDFVHPDGNALVTPMECVFKVEEFVPILEKLVRKNPNGNWFCRVNAGGHAFVIEYNKGKYQILQSFFGFSTLAQNIKRNKTFSVTEFHEKLILALSKNRDPGVVDAPTRALFGTAALKAPTTIEYRFITVPATEDKIQQRIKAFCQFHKVKWHGCLDEKMEKYITQTGGELRLDELRYTYRGRNSVELLIEQKSITDEFSFPFKSFEDFMKNYCKIGMHFRFKRNHTVSYKLSEINKDDLVFTINNA